MLRRGEFYKLFMAGDIRWMDGEPVRYAGSSGGAFADCPTGWWAFQVVPLGADVCDDWPPVYVNPAHVVMIRAA